MPTTCCAHSGPVSMPCSGTVEMPPLLICDLCECPFAAPWDGSVAEGSCCEPCMDMAAEVLRACFGPHAIESDDPDCWELLEGNEPSFPVEAGDCWLDARHTAAVPLLA
jgi:hypothetical protein